MAKDRTKGAKPALAAKAEAYIREHYVSKFSLDTMASALYVDKIYLAKTFKEVTGMTLLKFHNKVRCDAAAALLRETDLHIEVIGSRVGYATPSHFARLFRSIYGCSPSSYRKTYLKTQKKDPAAD